MTEIAGVPAQFFQDALTLLITDQEHEVVNYKHCANVLAVAEHGYQCQPASGVVLRGSWECLFPNTTPNWDPNAGKHRACVTVNLSIPRVAICTCSKALTQRGPHGQVLRMYFNADTEGVEGIRSTVSGSLVGKCTKCAFDHSKNIPCPFCGQVH